MKRIILFAFVALFAIPTASAQSPLELFQQARRLESVQGDLEGAIALYERIGASYGTDRALGARALFQMGQAYETLGQNDATRAYRRIVSEFADQAETVAMAEAALGRLVVPPEVLSTPESLLGPALPFIGDGSSLSHDGQYVVFTDWDTGRLGYLKLGDSQVQWVTPPPAEESFWSWASWGRFSPDNREIAYVWQNNADSSSAIRTFNRISGETREILNPRTRFGRGPNAGLAGVYDWTSDGSHILVEFRPVPGTVHMALIDREVGSVRHHVELSRLSTMPACLLDDRYVLFDDNSGGVNRVLRADLFEGSVQPFSTSEASSRLLGCSDQMQAAVVTSNEFGDFQAWLYKLDSGMPSGAGRHLQDLPDAAISAGGLVSHTGRLLYQKGRVAFSTGLYRYEGDSITERIEELPTTRFFYGLGFSPDGSRIAQRAIGNRLFVRDDEGKARDVTLTRQYREIRWLADGSGFVANWNKEESRFSSRIDLESGLPSDTLDGYATPGRSGAGVMQAHRRDAETVCIFEYARGPESRQLVVCYPDSRASEGPFLPLLEPGSDSISVLTGRRGSDEATGGSYATLVDATTGEVRVVSEIGPSFWSWQVFLMTDQDIVLDPRELSLYRAPSDGSERKDLFQRFGELHAILSYSLHPTESLILMTTRPRQGMGSVAGRPDRVGLLEDLWDRFD